MSLPRIIWDWVKRQIIGEVPEGEALCEYDCRKTQCTEGEWETCDRRLQRGAGELMPEKKPALETVAESTPVNKPDPGQEPQKPQRAAGELMPLTIPASATIAESTPANEPDPQPEPQNR